MKANIGDTAILHVLVEGLNGNCLFGTYRDGDYFKKITFSDSLIKGIVKEPPKTGEIWTTPECLPVQERFHVCLVENGQVCGWKRRISTGDVFAFQIDQELFLERYVKTGLIQL